MDDVSGLAERSNDFGSFLTVARKFSFTCLSVFHIMYPSKFNWKIIISQTKNLFVFWINTNIFNF